ncbi:MAG: glycoside hydrolase family 15 protein [Acidimicrobiales bacterium]|jgi:GH15 family glucan-1,4-alpha-glucosidase
MKQRTSGFEDLVAPSIRAMLANQRPNGALVASPDFAQYQYCWLRDGSFVAHALDRAGEHEASDRFHRWCASSIDHIAPLMEAALERVQLGKPVDPNEMPPARFSMEGLVVKDDWPNFQIDGYGTWLWSLHEHLERSGAHSLPERLVGAVERVGRYLAELGTVPCFDVWEENGGSVHTATLGCVYAGLVAASVMLGNQELRERADAVRSDVLERARTEGRFEKSNTDRQVDAALLWLSEPFGLCDPREPAFVETARVIGAELDLDGGIRRYPADTYYGGGAWPVLTASLGWYRASIGELEEARRRRDWIAERFDAEGRLGEQFGGERRDPGKYAEWIRRWGSPARDLVWSHAMYVVLCDELEVISRSAPAEVESTVSDLET